MPFAFQELTLVRPSVGDHCLEVVGDIGHLRSRHENGLLRREVRSEVLMKLCGVEVSETVCRLLYCSRFAEVTWEALSVVSLIFSSVGHVGRRQVNRTCR
jgi:hypothetical protein